MDRISIYTTASTLGHGEMVMVRVGAESVVLTAGEWSQLIRRPKRMAPPTDSQPNEAA
jgi:hypothetical protein